jgi:hypothetical protein
MLPRDPRMPVTITTSAGAGAGVEGVLGGELGGGGGPDGGGGQRLALDKS